MNKIPTRRLGRSGLQVSEIGLGTVWFLRQFHNTPRNVANAILDRAFSSGINFVDTASAYGAGEGEELVGRALKRTKQPVIVSTKIGTLRNTFLNFWGGQDESYQDEEMLMRVVEHSMHLIGRDHIDVMMIHEPHWPQWGIDRKTGDSVILTLLERLKQQGIIGAIGIGGGPSDLACDLIETGRFDVVLSWKEYDLVTQAARDRLIPIAKKNDVGIILGAPFRQGILSDKKRDLLADVRAGSKQHSHLDNETIIRRVEAIYDLSDESGIDLPEMGLRFLLSDSDISSVIPGPSTVEQLESNLNAAEKGPLPQDLLEKIEKINRDMFD
jgi:aryl-alcohol dehydrogenase-like predicted oxidoreductase